jgi:hypothetical protein
MGKKANFSWHPHPMMEMTCILIRRRLMDDRKLVAARRLVCYAEIMTKIEMTRMALGTLQVLNPGWMDYRYIPLYNINY